MGNRVGGEASVPPTSSTPPPSSSVPTISPPSASESSVSTKHSRPSRQSKSGPCQKGDDRKRDTSPRARFMREGREEDNKTKEHHDVAMRKLDLRTEYLKIESEIAFRELEEYKKKMETQLRKDFGIFKSKIVTIPWEETTKDEAEEFHSVGMGSPSAERIFHSARASHSQESIKDSLKENDRRKEYTEADLERVSLVTLSDTASGKDHLATKEKSDSGNSLSIPRTPTLPKPTVCVPKSGPFVPSPKPYTAVSRTPSIAKSTRHKAHGSAVKKGSTDPNPRKDAGKKANVEKGPSNKGEVRNRSKGCATASPKKKEKTLPNKAVVAKK